MNISWISPLDPQSSEIARYSEQIMPYLEQFASVVAIEDGAGGAAGAWRSQPEEPVPPAQGVAPLPIYHIGNNPLHFPIYQRSLEEPGLVVLHDLSLVDLARHLSHELEQPGLWKEMMCRQYGDEVRPLVNRSEKSVADYNEMVAHYPLFLPFVEGALGVVVHSTYARDALREQLAPGITVLQLNLPSPPPAEIQARTDSQGPLRFVFCGHVGPNRRLIEFLEAWSHLPEPGVVSLDLFGNISSSRQLSQYAEHYGVAEYVRFNGYVGDAELDEALQGADFAINLRWPTMGEASASQLRYWSAALPTLVSDVGWYGELPDDTVCKISVDNEAGDLLALLEDAPLAREKYRLLGRRGWERLHREHSAPDYVRDLIAFAADLAGQRFAHRMLERELVTTIAAMCENDMDARLFRDAIETAVATVAPERE
jgi:glycosyltransferase involved in cell wall biosynthesis